jgi:hypothetical protein
MLTMLDVPVIIIKKMTYQGDLYALSLFLAKLAAFIPGS